MNVSCKLSCGVGECSAFACVDQEPSCKALAANGECSQNPSFMHVKCRRSCNVDGCVKGMLCTNRHKLCSSWASQNECTKPYYQAYCMVSCGVCIEGTYLESLTAKSNGWILPSGLETTCECGNVQAASEVPIPLTESLALFPFASCYYQKYLDACGLPVLTSSKVDDKALRKVAVVVNKIMQVRPLL